MQEIQQRNWLLEMAVTELIELVQSPCKDPSAFFHISTESVAAEADAKALNHTTSTLQANTRTQESWRRIHSKTSSRSEGRSDETNEASEVSVQRTLPLLNTGQQPAAAAVAAAVVEGSQGPTRRSSDLKVKSRFRFPKLGPGKSLATSTLTVKEKTPTNLPPLSLQAGVPESAQDDYHAAKTGSGEYFFYNR